MFPPNDDIVEDVARTGKHAVVHGSGAALEVVLVLRKCRECGERKRLGHFLLHNGKLKHVQEDVVVGDVKVCAGCRMRHNDRYIRHTPPKPTHLGRYLDLPLDDWSRAS